MHKNILPYSTSGLLDNTYIGGGGGGEILPAPNNSVISKDMVLKIGMLK